VDLQVGRKFGVDAGYWLNLRVCKIRDCFKLEVDLLGVKVCRSVGWLQVRKRLGGPAGQQKFGLLLPVSSPAHYCRVLLTAGILCCSNPQQ
jgi:hypothetical protein